MTTTVSLQAVVAFWAAQLGCSEVQLAQPRTSVVRNGPELASFRGATVVFRPPACVLAVPADWYDPVASKAAGMWGDQVAPWTWASLIMVRVLLPQPA
jgi:hypothetical protein